MAFVDSKGKYARVAHDKCGSLWYHRFMMGLKARMGGVWKPNKALSLRLLLAVLDMAEEKINKRMKKRFVKIDLGG